MKTEKYKDKSGGGGEDKFNTEPVN